MLAGHITFLSICLVNLYLFRPPTAPTEENNHSSTPGKNSIHCFSSFRRHSTQWLAARCMVTTNLGTNAAIFLPFLISWTPEQLRKQNTMHCNRWKRHKGVQELQEVQEVCGWLDDLSSQRQHLRMAEFGLSHRQPFDQTYGNSTNTCPHDKIRAKQATALLQCQSSRPQCPSHERYLKNSVVSYPTKVRNQQLENISAV